MGSITLQAEILDQLFFSLVPLHLTELGKFIYKMKFAFLSENKFKAGILPSEDRVKISLL